MRNITLLSALLASVIHASPSAYAASIQVISGTLTVGPTTIVIPADSTGVYSAEYQQFADVMNPTTYQVSNQIVGSGSNSAQITTSGFDINAFSNSTSYLSPSYQFAYGAVRVAGQIVFDVVDGGYFNFSYDNPINPSNMGATINIKDSSTHDIFYCFNQLGNQYCVNNLNDNLPYLPNGELLLTPGQYTFNWNSSPDIAMGRASSPSLAFSLQSAVPLPASIWLFISGLCAMGVNRFNRSK